MIRGILSSWDESSEDYSRTSWTSEGKRKTDRVSGSSSYRGRLNVKFAILTIKSYWFFSTSVYSTVQIYLFHQERWRDSDIIMLFIIKRDLFVAPIKIKSQCCSVSFSVFTNYTIRRLSWWNDIQVELKELGLELNFSWNFSEILIKEKET